MGRIVLYEGNSSSQDIVQTFEDTSEQNSRISPNDKAQLLKLLNVRLGAVGLQKFFQTLGADM